MFRQNIKEYISDSLQTSRVKVQKPEPAINETYYNFVQQNRTNCDSLAFVPVYQVRVKHQKNNDYWLFDLDINGSIIWATQETELTGDWEIRYYEMRKIN